MGRYYLLAADRAYPHEVMTHEDAADPTNTGTNTTESVTVLSAGSTQPLAWRWQTPATNAGTSEWATSGWAWSVNVTAGNASASIRMNVINRYNASSVVRSGTPSSLTFSGTGLWTNSFTVSWAGTGTLADTDAASFRTLVDSVDSMMSYTLTLQLDNDSAWVDVPWTVGGGSGSSDASMPYIGGGYYP